MMMMMMMMMIMIMIIMISIIDNNGIHMILFVLIKQQHLINTLIMIRASFPQRASQIVQRYETMWYVLL